jgi:hypothetical protein
MALTDILGSLTSLGSGGIFDDFSGVIQNVGSIYDQFYGKSEDLSPAQSVPAPAPAPVPAAVTLPASQMQVSQTTLMIGAAVVIGLLLVFSRR